MYATLADLSQWIYAAPEPPAESPFPATTTRMLRHASGLVDDATLGARYVTNDAGEATDPGVIAALKQATCEYVAECIAQGIDPMAGPGQLGKTVAAKSGNGQSVTYGSDPGQAAREHLAAGRELTYGAWMILKRNGLISNGLAAAGVYSQVYAVRGYSPTTGQLDE
jgi:hypothetical protein